MSSAGVSAARAISASATERRRRWPEARWIERVAPEPLVALKSADALHNVRSILEDVEHHGADVLNRFRADPPDTHWYYATIADIARERLHGAAIADELTRAAADLGRFVAGLPR